MVPQELVTLFDLFTHAGFAGGVVAGLAALVVLFSLGKGTTRPLAGWGVVLAATTLAALAAIYQANWELIAAVGLLAVAGFLVDLAFRANQWLVRGAVLLAAAAVVTLAALQTASTESFPGELWLELSWPLAAVAIGLSMRGFRHASIAYLLGPLVAVSVFGVWATVPETDLIRVMLGASVGLAAATLPVVGWRVSGAGAFALAGLLTLLSIDGGITRASSILVAWACMGVVLLIPLLRLEKLGRYWLPTLGVHIVSVGLVSRVVGDWESMWAVGVGIAVMGLVTAVALMVFLAALEERDRSSPVEETSVSRS